MVSSNGVRPKLIWQGHQLLDMCCQRLYYGMSSTRGCAVAQPPFSSGSRSGAEGYPGGRRHDARSTRSHARCTAFSSASVQGINGAEYLNRAVATMCMAGTI